MFDINELIGHWGYWAIFFTVILGNMGIPVPEEAVLLLAGYLVWAGKLRLPAVLLIGILSAVTGDNIGYWIGRRFGPRVIARYRRWLFVTQEKFDAAQRLVVRYGPWGVFGARFLPGLRFLAGPLAGSVELPFGPFFTANLLGAAVYVPLAVGLGFAAGYGFGQYVEKVQRFVGEVERVVLIAAAAGAVAAVLWRVLRTRRAGSKASKES
jgi:membrane protein DedA with SNARE-associated domain